MLKTFRFNNTIATLISLGIISSFLPSFLFPPNKIETNPSLDLTQSSIFNTNTSGNTSEESDDIGKIVGITALGVGATSLAWYFNQSKTRSLSPAQKTFSVDRVNPKLRKKLLKLVYNNEQTANRLLTGASFSHPGRSLDWLADKVIYDLQRDRGL
jgi:hypothetical protein